MRFSMFTLDELDILEAALCFYRAGANLIDEIRAERERREKNNWWW